MQSEEITKLLIKCENIESILYISEYSDFNNFAQMENYLEAASLSLEEKINQLDRRRDLINDELITASSVYQINNKKRQKEQQLLNIERQKLKKQLENHSKRLQVSIHPMTMLLKQKQSELQKLKQCKDIVEDFNKLVCGNEEQISKMLLFDEKHFKNSALKVYVFKTILEDINNEEYHEAKTRVNKKYADLKNKILHNFKEGFWKNDQRLILNALPYCEEYELLDEVSDFYNEQAFREVHKIQKINQIEAISQIKNLFFLIQRGIIYAFSTNQSQTGQRNMYEVSTIFGSYQESIARGLITFAFDKLIRESLESVLKMTYNSNTYLAFLELFFNQCKTLIKNSQQYISYQKTIHLMSTYFQSIFDTHLDSYLQKELKNLLSTYEVCVEQIMKQVKFTDSVKLQDYPSSNNKFKLGSITDYRISTKRQISGQQMEGRIQGLLKTFMNPALEQMFDVTKKALQRNNKIGKINEIDRNRNEIINVFVKNLGDLVESLIKQIGQIVPRFDQQFVVHPDFFQVLPHLTMLLQRMELIYEEFRKQAKYQLTEGMKLQQKKQNLLNFCEKQLNRIVASALASILSFENMILKSDQKIYYLTTPKNQLTQPCSKISSLLEKYLKVINKISLKNYKESIMKSVGLQFINLLIDHYSSILYSKDGLGKIFLDIANFKKIVIMVNSDEVENKYKSLRSLIDIYVIKNDQKVITSYINQERETNLRFQKQQIIKAYISNKKKNERQ